MTREEAWRRTKCYLYDVLCGEEADEIINALDQQPCGDLISRQAVLETQAKYAEHIGATKFWQMRDDIRALPSVEYETDEDCISRERVLLEINRIGFDAFTSYDYYSNLYDFIDGLPSEELERKTGKWKWDKRTGTYHCSECGHDPLHEDVGELEEYKYCMNCGAEMDVDE